MPAPPSLPLFADPMQVQIQPVPTEITPARLVFQGRPLVGIQVLTPQGVTFYFLEPEVAERLGDALKATAAGVIPSASLIEPPVGGRM